MSPALRRRFALPFVALPFVMLLVASCGSISGSPPPATPTDFGGLAGGLGPLGIHVTNVVSGDAGCSDPELIPTAIGFDASGLDQTSPVRLRIYIFRDRAAWQRHRTAIGPCAAAFVTDPAAFEEIEQSPYIVAGQGPWAPGFKAALRSGLEKAAGTGD